MAFDRLRFVLGFIDEATRPHVRDDELELVESFFRDDRRTVFRGHQHLCHGARGRDLQSRAQT